jgi:alanine racemase
MQYFPSILEINLKALKNNYRLIKGLVKKAEVSGVVKANGYGLGAEEVVKALYEEGCRTFFVAHADEALKIYSLRPDIHVYVLNGLMTGDIQEFASYPNITPVLNSLRDIKVWQEMAKKADKKLPAVIHVDTGMNRLGLGTDERNILLNDKESLLEGLDIHFIMSHFSSADEKDHPETPRQAKEFKEIMSHFPSIKGCLCNSAGIFVSSEYHYDHVRPGMALYGLNPTPHQKNPMEQVVRLSTKILNIQTIKAGEHVGYGASYRSEKGETVATANLGYADGFLRSLSNKGHLYWNGQACPIRGRVSMDLVTVSIDHLQEKPQIGDMLEVIGPSQDADALADISRTIGYEILTSLGTRYKKKYIN